jgi:hypothetical protein
MMKIKLRLGIGIYGPTQDQEYTLEEVGMTSEEFEALTESEQDSFLNYLLKNHIEDYLDAAVWIEKDGE